MELLGKIGVDPKLILAQAVNFLGLVFILRILVYKPIVAIFKRREELAHKLEDDLAQIEKRRREAEAASRAKLLEAESRANEILAQARKTASTLEERSYAENRRYLDDLLRETKSRIEGAKAELARFNEENVAREARELALRFLSSHLRRDLHRELLAQTLRDLEELASREDDIAFKDAVEVSSAQDLNREDRVRLQRVLYKKFGKRIPVTWSQASHLGAGVQIQWNGYILDGSLEKRLRESVK